MSRNSMLCLSGDKEFITDIDGHQIMMRRRDGDHEYYQLIGIESDGYRKVCNGFKTFRVCVLQGERQQCLQWADVQVCTQFEVIPDARTE